MTRPFFLRKRKRKRGWKKKKKKSEISVRKRKKSIETVCINLEHTLVSGNTWTSFNTEFINRSHHHHHSNLETLIKRDVVLFAKRF